MDDFRQELVLGCTESIGNADWNLVIICLLLLCPKKDVGIGH